MMKRIIGLMLLLLALTLLTQAQDATSEPTAEVTSAVIEATAEPTDVVEAEITVDPAECPTLVQTAIDLTQQSCETTQVNEACYGHILLEATSRVAAEEFQFSNPGDVVDVIAIESLQLSALDTFLGQWGVMLMEIEANVQTLLEESATTDDVQLLLFGDAQLTDASQFVRMIANTNVRIRSLPSTNGQILGVLNAGDPIIANAQLDDSSWVRVRINTDDDTELGWIAADFVTPQGDLSILPTLTPQEAAESISDLAAEYGPMQAFFFQSGVDDAPCEEAPNSGLLVQTPEGVASVTLWMDEVVIQMDGTGFVQAEPNGDLTVNVLDGAAQVEANGEIRTAVAGTAVSVPLDENLSPAGEPSAPQPIDPNDVQALPLDLLDDEVEVAQAPALPAGQPLEGLWRFSWGADQLVCPATGAVVPFVSTAQTSALQATEDSLMWGGIRYNETSTGVYRATYVDPDGNLHQDTLQVLGLDLIIGEKVLDLVNPVCTLDVSFRLQLIETGG